jgi:hypothetical protein
VKRVLLVCGLVLVLGVFLVGCATKTDAEAVEDSITGLIAAYNAENYDKCLTYLVGITDENKAEIKAGLAWLHGFMGNITVTKVENIVVNGSSATANVTLKFGEQTQTSNMTLSKVDGKWKMSGEDMFSQD